MAQSILRPRQGGLIALLPVIPPEINPILLIRMQDVVFIVFQEFRIQNIERNAFLLLRIQSEILTALPVLIFEEGDAVGRVDVEGHMKAQGMEILQESLVVREQRLIEGIAGPADDPIRRLSEALTVGDLPSGLVFMVELAHVPSDILKEVPPVGVGGMPVHIDRCHGERGHSPL
jgi:hypothetical protein